MNMNWLFVIPMITNLMQMAERYFRGEKRGPEKKTFVMDTSKMLIDGAVKMSTGGQKATWDVIAEPVSQLIDSVASIAFRDEDEMNDEPMEDLIRS